MELESIFNLVKEEKMNNKTKADPTSVFVLSFASLSIICLSGCMLNEVKRNSKIEFPTRNEVRKNIPLGIGSAEAERKLQSIGFIDVRMIPDAVFFFDDDVTTKSLSRSKTAKTDYLLGSMKHTEGMVTTTFKVALFFNQNDELLDIKFAYDFQGP